MGNKTPLIWYDQGGCNFVNAVSNNYLDGDAVPDLLTRESHLKFIDKFNSGGLSSGELYLFFSHYPAPVGVVTELRYEFDHLISKGVFYPDFYDLADALLDSDISWGMSHGMWADSIKRGENKVEIVEYESFEVSILPVIQSANVLTASVKV